MFFLIAVCGAFGGCATSREGATREGERTREPVPFQNHATPPAEHPRENWIVRAVKTASAAETPQLLLAVTPAPVGEPSIWPLGAQGREIISAFGKRRRDAHRGMDIRNPFGAPVVATADGLVIFAGYERGYGKVVVLQHPGQIETRYAHLNTCDVAVGDQVRQGQSLGAVGQTGNASTPHLHYEVRLAGKPVNPGGYLPAE
ncbi:MAG: M23 family metallopeptidase [Candidatus Hydrogenedentes bacterium]|nr:M23 family metallopeptidase [Candidatus Hydrogenedentota bacterium]